MRIAVAGATGRLGTHLVQVLEERGHGVVRISRSDGLDLTTAVGLEQALRGVDAIIDAATWPTPDRAAATSFFTTASRNLHDAGQAAGVQRMVVVSIVGIDRQQGDYQYAKQQHEKAALAGPIPTRIVRAAQFREFVGAVLDWGTQGEIGYVPDQRTQLVAARSVAEVLVDLATAPAFDTPGGPPLEVAGPRPERFVDAATLLAAKRGHPAKVEVGENPADPDQTADAADVLLPSPDAMLVGPTFEAWLETADA